MGREYEVKEIEELVEKIASIVEGSSPCVCAVSVTMYWKVNRCELTFKCEDRGFKIGVTAHDEFWAERRTIGKFEISRGLAQELQRVGALTWVTYSMEEHDITYVYDVSI